MWPQIQQNHLHPLGNHASEIRINSITFDFIAAVLICKTNATINNIHFIEAIRIKIMVLIIELKPFHY
jgi:hypothetical protein